MGSWEYFVISSYIFPIGIGMALLIQRRLSFAGGVLWAYLLFTFGVELISSILASKGINNLWLYRIYMYGELVFPILFFFNQFSKQRSKILLLIVLITALVLTTLTNIFDDWSKYASVQTSITFACIAFVIISYFVEMFQLEKVFNPFKDVYFVVGGVMLLSYSSILLYNVLYDYVIRGYVGSEVRSILHIVNSGLILFYNVLYSYALWLSRYRLT
ncbi:hypothetical protein [Fluviicola sp.]|uniref:hypothetical protein n=1 Tax=Fluviicola sp. TaxID=1917219 RepID=UPI0031CF9779